MAVQQVNVYSFHINLKSKQNHNDHIGANVTAVGATPQAAAAAVQQAFAGDLTGIMSAATLVREGSYTTLA
jgi:hypothetical protein